MKGFCEEIAVRSAETFWNRSPLVSSQNSSRSHPENVENRTQSLSTSPSAVEGAPEILKTFSNSLVMDPLVEFAEDFAADLAANLDSRKG